MVFLFSAQSVSMAQYADPQDAIRFITEIIEVCDDSLFPSGLVCQNWFCLFTPGIEPFDLLISIMIYLYPLD